LAGTHEKESIHRVIDKGEKRGCWKKNSKKKKVLIKGRLWEANPP